MAILKATAPPTIRSPFDYWMTHFLAALWCLSDNTLLEHRPDRHRCPTDWSLCDYAGMAPKHAFEVMKSHIRNWGFQYLMVQVLNDPSWPVLQYLKEDISEIGGIDISTASVRAQIAGIDSRTGRNLEAHLDAKIFGDLRRSVKSSAKLIKNTDLCLVVDGARDYRVAIFGEVEGNHGNRLTNEAFWLAKSPLAKFAIGVVQTPDPKIYHGVFELSGGPRAVVLFPQASGLAADFYDALDWLAFLIDSGPETATRTLRQTEPELSRCIRFLADNFRRPVHLLWEDLGFRRAQTSVPLASSAGDAPAILHAPSILLPTK